MYQLDLFEDEAVFEDNFVHDKLDDEFFMSSTPSSKATDVQVGGGHYKDLAIQPAEFIYKNNMDFLSGNVVKYISRWKNKNGIEDLKKAKHYIDLIIEFEYGNRE